MEQTAWGRCYADVSGAYRDLWLLSFGSAKPDRPAAEKAAAANVALRGHAIARQGGRRDWRAGQRRVGPRPEPAVSRVRVLDVGCSDGSYEQMADWSRPDVEREFTEHAKPVLARAITAVDVRPGASCVGCKALSGCVALPRTPQLFTATPRERVPRRRSVSVSDLRAYADCPAKYLLTRQLKLKATRPENAPIRLGRAVDGLLNHRHGQHPIATCALPVTAADLQAQATTRAPLLDDDAEQGVKMLHHHTAVCPLPGLSASDEVQVQHLISCYIPELNVVALATPDLLHTRSGGWVWRETKTSGTGLFEGRPLLVQYPQLALAVLMINAGVLGGDIARSRVELELLTADDVVLEELDPSRARVVDDARAVISDLATPWMQDTSFDPRPGRACYSCEALDWCAPGKQHIAAKTTAEER